MQVLAAYDRALQRSPLVVKTLTSAALFGLGDALSQKLEGKVIDSHDARLPPTGMGTCRC